MDLPLDDADLEPLGDSDLREDFLMSCCDRVGYIKVRGRSLVTERLSDESL
jgi:hypothetical protein